ncbi:helix-turn-helix domain-containing protein [Streptococcus sanguinis]|uniref:helix-turn-helix domain-containing protein n=1 Tax=Streptococcus sanguinis TaxID=1305 RepID=UPI001CBDAC0D|nr:helix-turn-helix transcriptional regulator [Streptococcus sanguinis]MBZ2023732.1 helix-turn-helix domain-containing protein [Streptococcus sanguinis]MBZ2048563.1 helix-turn-helix domain-containing protein [Streptococcus sanguinis]MBZ2050928.1 helix-turn-helix domain-containing protein [Streptococcus sanguinis]MBZ2059999.1 helix-turn-helix domain-containing protein [Streptococcus sanguinis]MBZ2066826.1 helix-turn-helix domain-containing protein [Streptococcus sanguinis]
MKKARLDARLTQLEVAEKLGVAQAQYARWENGGRNPKDETVEKLAKIFNTSFETLKGRDDGLEEIVSLLREYELTEKEKKEIISVLKQFLMNKKQAHKNNLMSLFYK